MDRQHARAAFSLVEVVLAIGIMATILIAIVALLPVGASSNQNSAEATRAAGILTTLEADLRNSHPAAANGKSQLFGLTLPYTLNGTAVVLNTNLPAKTVDTIALDEGERPRPLSTIPRPRYQASVIYTQIPANAAAPMLARLVVAWPSQNSAAATNLTDMSKIKGFVETYVAFPAP